MSQNYYSGKQYKSSNTNSLHEFKLLDHITLILAIKRNITTGAGLSVVPGMGKPATRPGFFKPLKQTKPSFRREKITKRRKPKPGVGLGGEFVESESTYHPKHFEETKHFGAKEWDKWPAWFKTTLHPGKKGSKNKLKKQTKAGLPFADSKRQFPEQEIPSGTTNY